MAKASNRDRIEIPEPTDTSTRTVDEIVGEFEFGEGNEQVTARFIDTGGEVPQLKRKPGRPKGSRNRSTDGAGPTEAVDSVSAEVKERKTRTRKIDHTNDAKAVLWLIDNIAVMMYGQGAESQPVERAMIEPSMARLLDRLPVSVSKHFQPFIDAGVLCIGFGAWYMRLEAQKAQIQMMLKAQMARTGPVGVQTEQGTVVNQPNANVSQNGRPPTTPITTSSVTADLANMLDQEP